jgi:FKBP-type peptidyl-prolyl cis-trans isomerase
MQQNGFSATIPKYQKMSDIKNQIKAVFAKYNIEPSALGIKFEDESTEAAAEPATEVKFAVEGTLSDGTKIYSTANEWVAGVDIYTQDAEGNPVPVPAGEYILEDGVTMVSVTEDGIVAQIGEMEVETEMSSEDLVAVIGQLSERIAVLETEKTELAAAVESAKNDAQAAKTELASVKKAPAVPSVKSQEFKKSNAVVASNGTSFSDFMENIRAKQSK